MSVVKLTESPLSQSELEALQKAESIEARLDALGVELMSNAFYLMDKIKLVGKKKVQKEIEAQEELQKQFKVICTTYAMLKKLGRVSAKSNDNLENQLLEKVKKSQGSLGAIVTRIDAKRQSI